MNDAETLELDVPTSKSVSRECEIYLAANENESSKKKKLKKKLKNLTNCNRMIFVLRCRK